MIKLAVKVFGKMAVKTTIQSAVVYGVWLAGKEFGKIEGNNERQREVVDQAAKKVGEVIEKALYEEDNNESESVAE